MRKSREESSATVMGLNMRLNPHELVERLLLFAPQLYDRREISFLKNVLPKGGVFLDLGSNVGYYSVVASNLIGPRGRVIAVDADPYSYNKVTKMIEENNVKNILAKNVGLSDRVESLQLQLQLTGNRGGNTFLYTPDKNAKTITVQCMPLLDLIRENGIQSIDVAKLDIEGFEYKVLKKFFDDAEITLWPKHLIVERNTSKNLLAGADVNELLSANGYQLKFNHGDNYAWSHKSYL
jgi:FkbM family methyltransferase